MHAVQFLAEWGVRSSVLILSGALVLWLLRKRASLRLTAWTAVLVGSLAIPFLTAVLPAVPMTVLRAQRRVPATVSGEASRDRQTQFGPGITAGLSAPAAPNRTAATRLFDPTLLTLSLYGLVSGVLLLRLFAGLLVSLRILRLSHPTGIAAQRADVRESDQVASPVTIGILRPTMLLPRDWNGWDSVKLAAVLAHERSHIRRHDPAVQLLSGIHRALLWASPLSWFLHNSIVRTAEEVSDEEAVAATGDRFAYAEILLEFVRRGVGGANWAGVPMARYDRPEKRIRRILNSTVAPRRASRWGIAGVIVLSAPFAWLSAAIHPLFTELPQAVAAVPQSALQPTPAAALSPPAGPAGSQTSTQPSPALVQFEVASVKSVDPAVAHEMGTHVYPGGRVVIRTFPLKGLIETAFGVSYWQISGGDEWTEKDSFDVEAKPADAMQPAIKDLRYTLFGIEDEQLRGMLQALLIKRFQLKFHLETRTGDVYLLERSGKPLPLRPVEFPARDAGLAPDTRAFGSIGYVGGKWGIFATSMPQLAQFASSFVFHVPVLDRTGLAGRFDYTQREPDIDPQYSGDQSDSFRAYLKELGLTLERAKGPVETFVIDGAAKPLPN